MILIEQNARGCPDAAARGAVELLSRDERQNALLLGRLRHGFAADIGIYKNSVRLRDTRSGNYMFAAEDEESFERLYSQSASKPRIFFLADGMPGHGLTERGLTVDVLHQWLIERPVQLLPADPAFEFAPARPSDLDLIMSVYRSKEFDRDYVADVIRENLSVCAYDKDRLAGFMLTHKDGETGPMVILDRYRKRGLGGQLVRRISNMMLERGMTPIGHIAPDNAVSAHIHWEAGYRPCEKPVIWAYDSAFEQ